MQRSAGDSLGLFEMTALAGCALASQIGQTPEAAPRKGVVRGI
jgi:hypothetical protein